MVFAHGVEDHWESWRELANVLDSTWRTVALEMPWRHGNDYLWRHGGTAGQWLARGLSQVDGPVDLLVGHSLGANAVLELLATGDTRVAAAAVVCPPYQRSPDDMTWEFLQAMVPRLHGEFRELVRIRSRDRRRPVEPRILETMAAKVIERISPISFLAVLEHYVAAAALDLEAIAVPTFVVSVGNDPGLSVEGVKDLVSRIPGATTCHQDELGHFCHVHGVNTLAAELKQFIRTNLP